MNTYKILNICQANQNQYCEHCGRVISWQVILLSDSNIKIRVGIDCAKTLTRKEFNTERLIRNLKNGKFQSKYIHRYFYKNPDGGDEKEITRQEYIRKMSLGWFGLREEKTLVK